MATGSQPGEENYSPPESEQSSSRQSSLLTSEYRGLVELFAQAIWETNADGTVLVDSPSWRAYTGQTLEEWLNEGWVGAVRDDEQAYALQQWQEAIHQRSPFSAEFHVRNSNNVWRLTTVKATPILSADGSVDKWLSVAFERGEHKRAEEDLRQSEERYRTLVQNLPDYAIFRIDPNGFITEWTEGAQRVIGYTADEAIGQHLSLYYTSEALAAGELEQELQEASETGRAERESIRVRKGGEQFWVNEIATAIREPGGQLVGFTKISRDITRRKQGQQTRKWLEERTRIAVEAADLATWEWDLPTDDVYWNEQHFKLLGMNVQAGPVKSAVFLAHIHPEDSQWLTQELTKAIEQHSIYDANFRIIRNDGVIRWMSGYGRVTELKSGKATRMSGVMFDITERKNAEEALRQSEERLQIVMSSITDHAMITYDPQNIITGWNVGAQHMFGFTAQEAIGQSGHIIFTPEDRATGQPEKEIEGARRDGRAADERYHIRKDGSRLYVSGVMSPLYDASRELIGYVKVARDLTQRQQMEQALKESDRRKDEFMALLAHELRNPMATLHNTLLILKLTGGKDPGLPLQSAVAMMGREVAQLVRLVDDLLDVSRISQGKAELTREPIELKTLVSQTAEASRSLVEVGGRRFTVSLPSEPLYIHGDTTRLTQIMRNLLSNAVKFTREGGHIELGLDRIGEDAVLRVRDNGIGIPANQLSYIFEMFAQVDASRTRSQGGLGLGLTLVRQFAEMHGGRVEAHSEGLGRGSEFCVYLPILY